MTNRWWYVPLLAGRHPHVTPATSESERGRDRDRLCEGRVLKQEGVFTGCRGLNAAAFGTINYVVPVLLAFLVPGLPPFGWCNWPCKTKEFTLNLDRRRILLLNINMGNFQQRKILYNMYIICCYRWEIVGKIDNSLLLYAFSFRIW